MQKYYALVRVSDEQKQNFETQVHAIKSYCNKHRIVIDQWHEFKISGSKNDRSQRGITHVINLLQPGDHLITTDLPRLGRQSVSDLMEIALKIINQRATLHFCYSGETLSADDQNNPTKLFLTLAESYTAWRFAEERSQKAKAATDRRKSNGLHNGRKSGAIVKSKLDQYESNIIAMKNDGISEYKISDHFKVHRTTLRTWLKLRIKYIEQSKKLGLHQLGQSITQIKSCLKNHFKTNE